MVAKVCSQCGIEKDSETDFRNVGNQYTGTRLLRLENRTMSICKVCYEHNQEQRKQERTQRKADTLAEEVQEKLTLIKPEYRGIITANSAWIYARQGNDTYPEDTELSGKWCIFPQTSEFERVWNVIVAGVYHRQLGRAAKIAPYPKTNGEHAVCIYSYNSDDKKDLLRMLIYLRKHGVTHRAMYKENRETRVGNYARVAFLWDKEQRQESNRSPIKWYAREGRIELLTPRNYTPFNPAWLEE